jgi:hypothetical protein
MDLGATVSELRRLLEAHGSGPSHTRHFRPEVSGRWMSAGAGNEGGGGGGEAGRGGGGGGVDVAGRGDGSPRRSLLMCLAQTQETPKPRLTTTPTTHPCQNASLHRSCASNMARMPKQTPLTNAPKAPTYRKATPEPMALGAADAPTSDRTPRGRTKARIGRAMCVSTYV